jgi:hypothetical protein
MKTKKKKLPDVCHDIKQLHADFHYYDAEDRQWWDKFKGVAEIGQRVCWYYSDEAQFYKEEFGKEKGFTVRDYAQHSGILVPRPDVERGSDDLDAYMVCMDAYPCEKENPRIDWVSLARLCDNSELVEVFVVKKSNTDLCQPEGETS